MFFFRARRHTKKHSAPCSVGAPGLPSSLYSHLLFAHRAPRNPPALPLSSLLSLYRRLLRAHATSLPAPLRALGDATVKAEWRAMVASSAKAEHESGRADRGAWAVFATSWAGYVDALTPTARGGGPPLTGDLSPADIEALTPDQRARVRRMAAAAGEVAKLGEEKK